MALTACVARACIAWLCPMVRFGAVMLALLGFEAHAAEPALSSIGSHAIALDRDGAVYSWGFDGSGQLGVGRTITSATPTRIAEIPAMFSAVAGVEHVAALDAGGRVWTWGSNVGGGLGPRDAASTTKPARVVGIANAVAIAAGRDNTFALLEDGTVWVWGRFLDDPSYNRTEIRQIAGLAGITRIDARWEHLVALRNDGTVWTVGLNATGAIGDSTTTNRSSAYQVPGITGAVEIAAGISTTVVLKADGAVLAWGGTSTAVRTSPAPVSGLADIRAIAASGDAFAVKADGTVVRWGDSYSPSPLAGFAGIARFVAAHTDAVLFGVAAAGGIVASGSNAGGELGVGHYESVAGVVAIPGTADFVQLSSGHGFAVARRNDGAVFIWGHNDAGQLGTGELLNRAVPRKVQGLPGDVVSIAAGGAHSLALAADGRVWAWGFGNFIGDPASRSRSLPQPITGLEGVVQVTAGRKHSLFRLATGDVWIAFHPAFEGGPPGLYRVEGLRDIVAIASGGYNAYAIRNDGALFAWGSNFTGQIGDGTTATRFDPVRVSTIAGRVIAISAQNHVLALTDDGRVWSWGENTFGALGDGTTTDRLGPAVVPGLATISAVAAGSHHSMALRADGTVLTWGANFAGELGDGTTGNRTTPAPVSGLQGARRIAAGPNRSFASTEGGPVWAWGGIAVSSLILDGALGDGTFASRLRPVLVLREEEGNGNLDGNKWYLDLDAAAADDLPASALRSIVPVAQLSGSAQSLSLSAGINFRLSDYGKTVGTFVIGKVPAAFFDQVKTAPSLTKARVEALAKSGEPILVQLTPLGWTTLSGQLIALTTGVVNANGAATNILNGIDIRPIPGARFCVGYGESGVSMLNAHTLADVLSLEGATATVQGLPCVLSGVYVSGPPTSKQGTQVTFTSTVVGLSPDGSVQFIDGVNALGGPVSGTPRSEAVATASLTTSGLVAGAHSIGARYLGDARNAARETEIPLLHTVAAPMAGTSTSITGPVSSTIGDAVLFTAVVTGDNPSGTVQLHEGGAALAGPAALLEGTATVILSGLPLGTHGIDASYSGDARNAPSVSNILSHSVFSEPGARVELATSANPVAEGAPLDLTVTVFGSNPQGEVVFRDADAVLGRAALVNAVAQLRVPSLAAGSHVLRADYAGDGSHQPASSPALFQQVSAPASAPNPPRLANISTRMAVLTGDDVLIGGFIVGGSTAKTVVVRARGPSLTAAGVPNVLVNPVLNLYSGQTVIASNDDWHTASNASTLLASGFSPPDSREAAIYMTLGPGAYTAIMLGAGGTTGVGLVEVFEVDGFTTPLINISTRGAVQTGDNVMIGGFIIQGSGPQTVVVRARGPSLAAAGVPNLLVNPMLSLYSGHTVIASNDDWQTAANAATVQSSGFAPPDARESAIYVTLNPGAYTAIVQGVAGTTGVGIVEVFAVP